MTTNLADHFALDHATIWTGDGRAFRGYVVVRKGIIDAVERDRYGGELPRVDCHGMALAPGLVDIMVGGGFDQSLLHGNPVEIARRYLKLGVTTCQFAVGTLKDSDRPRLIQNLRSAMAADRSDIAAVAGTYFEGPFYDPVSIGANNAALVWPTSRDNARRLLNECGDVIKMANVSPGVENDCAAIETLARAGVAVTMAHSAARVERVTACIEAGTSQLGHAWNNRAAAPMVEPGVYAPTLEHVAFQDERIRFIHVISDGVHVHPSMIRLILRCRGVEAVCVVSDAMNRAGAPDGPFTFDSGLRAKKVGKTGRLETGELAGSAVLLPDQFRFFVGATGLPAHEAVRTVTHNPAESLGLDSQIGLIRRGYHADLVCFDEHLRVRRVWKRGYEIEPESIVDHA